MFSWERVLGWLLVFVIVCFFLWFVVHLAHTA